MRFGWGSLFVCLLAFVSLGWLVGCLFVCFSFYPRKGWYLEEWFFFQSTRSIKAKLFAILISTEQGRGLMQDSHARSAHLILWSLKEFSERLSKSTDNTSVRLISATAVRETDFSGCNYQQRKPSWKTGLTHLKLVSVTIAWSIYFCMYSINIHHNSF